MYRASGYAAAIVCVSLPAECGQEWEHFLPLCMHRLSQLGNIAMLAASAGRVSICFATRALPKRAENSLFSALARIRLSHIGVYGFAASIVWLREDAKSGWVSELVYSTSFALFRAGPVGIRHTNAFCTPNNTIRMGFAYIRCNAIVLKSHAHTHTRTPPPRPCVLCTMA